MTRYRNYLTINEAHAAARQAGYRVSARTINRAFHAGLLTGRNLGAIWISPASLARLLANPPARWRRR